MIVKMQITFEYDPETNEYTPIKQELIKEKPHITTKAEEAEDSAEPQITLEANKYVLNKAAAELMGVEWQDRLDIKYQPIENNKLLFPIIGTDTVWKTKAGNKLTKNLSVSCRGNANSLLSGYGDTFTVTPWKGHDGLFVLIGNKDRPKEDENIEIKEDDNSNVDIPEKEDFPLDTELDNEEAYKIDDLSFEI